MDARDIDLKLLMVFDSMLESASVTLTGRALKLSQPATSAALARLRALFEDPLFVKIGVRMEPTPRALELAPVVRSVVDTMRHELLADTTFDSKRTTRRFAIITPDIGEVGILPAVLSRFAIDAPMASIRCLSLTPDVALRALEGGDADVALGFHPELKQPGLFQAKLFTTDYVCVARREHATIGSSLSIEQYLAASHAVVAPQGQEHLVDAHLRRRGVDRRVLLLLPHFMSLVAILPTCDMIATVPRQIAQACARHADLKLLKPPIDLPTLDIHLTWHQRFHRDRGNMWLRQLLQETVRY